MYDNQVLNVLLNLARNHLAKTFKLFVNYEATSDSSHALCLAMAAIGALYLGVDCGDIVAKTLYNDARRLHFEDFHSSYSRSSFLTAVDSVKTFILLEIYGICSGDKRSYEFVEAFHLSMMQAVKYCYQLAPSRPDESESQELLLIAEALDIIESYHVLLLQRPPYFFPTSLDPELDKPLNLDLTPLFWSSNGSGTVLGSIREVARLGAYTWAASPRGKETPRQGQLWRSEFLELGLERWIKARSRSSSTLDLPSLLLYHLSHLRLKVNLRYLQTSARELVNGVDTNTNQEGGLHQALQNYTSGRPFEAAVWHSKAMFHLVRDSMSKATNSVGQSNSTTGPHALEPPHLPYCIYFSTLVMWYSEDTAGSSFRSLARDACIRSGINLLGMFKARIAKVLTSSLRELVTEGT